MTNNRLVTAVVATDMSPSTVSRHAGRDTSVVNYRRFRPGVAALVAVAIAGLACDSGPTEPDTGVIKIQVATAGSPLDTDADGYSVLVDDAPPRSIAPNGAVTIAALSRGSHVVKLTGFSENCSISGSSTQTIELIPNRGQIPSVIVAFAAACVPHVGTLTVSTTSTGDEQDLDGYVLFVAPGREIVVPPNGTTTISDVRVGQPSLSLLGISPNCDVDGVLPRPVEIVFGGTVDVSFSVRCRATGTLHITTTTTGDATDPDGYELGISLGAKGFYRQVRLPTGGAVDLDGLAPGNYSLTLLNVIDNCAGPLPNPWPATIASGSMTSVAVNVACKAPSQIMYVVSGGGPGQLFTVLSNGTQILRFPIQQGSNTDPAWSPNGTRIAFASDRDGNREIYVMDASGQNINRLTSAIAADYRPAWSPDGSRIAFVSERDGNAEIYVMNSDGTDLARLTTNAGSDGAPSWSPDGTSIAFQSDRDAPSGRTAIWKMNADGSEPRRLTSTDLEDAQPAWSPDGTVIAFSRTVTSFVRDIYFVKPDGSSLIPFTSGLADAADPAWSADGRYLAFSMSSCDYYYYYYDYNCDTVVATIPLNRSSSTTMRTLASGFNPSWRP